MTLHLCRDFVTLPTASSPGTNMYAMAIFLYHVLNYRFITHRNFPLQSSSYEKGTYTILSGNILYAEINTGSATGYQVLIPTASYLVTSSDVDRILALKSDNFPKANSGLFRITSTTPAQNLLTIDYRVSSGTFPPPDDQLFWRIYEKETTVASTWSSGSNTPGELSASSARFGYGSWDAGNSGELIASASRIILQSPDPSEWQVRLCLESDVDVKSGSCPVGFSMAPGFFTATPPFDAPLQKSLHGPLFYNTTQSLFRGTAVGLGPSMINNTWTTGSWRIMMWGHDDNGTCVIANRSQTLLASGWAAFGFPEDELDPLDPEPNPNTMQRLFVMGSPRSLGTLEWRTDFFTPTLLSSSINCVVWGNNEQPVPGTLSCYADLFNQTTHIRNIAQAGTSSFGGYTELIDVEILAGMHDTIQTPTTSSVFEISPRRVGRFPLARLGAGKYRDINTSVGYTTWSHSPDASGDPGTGPRWLHLESGIFMPWEGPALSGSTVGSQIWAMSGSIFDDEGILFYEGNHPGFDPELPPPPVPKSIDATRYRKTYTYFRQPVVETTAVKVGSNKPK